MPILPGATARSIAEHGPARTRQYAQVGVFLSAHCHVLLAVWDGKDSELMGGTAATVRFHHHDVMPGYTPRVTSSKLNLTVGPGSARLHTSIFLTRVEPIFIGIKWGPTGGTHSHARLCSSNTLRHGKLRVVLVAPPKVEGPLELARR